MLHTDFYNKNNKHKMQKADYVKNTSTSDEGISHDILEVMIPLVQLSLKLTYIVLLCEYHIHTVHPHGR